MPQRSMFDVVTNKIISYKIVLIATGGSATAEMAMRYSSFGHWISRTWLAFMDEIFLWSVPGAFRLVTTWLAFMDEIFFFPSNASEALARSLHKLLLAGN